MISQYYLQLYRLYFGTGQGLCPIRQGLCNEDWPCNFTNKSEVRGYLYLNLVLQMSILTENDVKNIPKYHYMCFSISRIL